MTLLRSCLLLRRSHPWTMTIPMMVNAHAHPGKPLMNSIRTASRCWTVSASAFSSTTKSDNNNNNNDINKKTKPTTTTSASSLSYLPSPPPTTTAASADMDTTTVASTITLDNATSSLSSSSIGSEDTVASTSASTSSSLSSPSDEVFERTVYVHPLSQIILEYLQDCRYDWLYRYGLERGLTIHRDGSFELTFPKSNNLEQDKVPHKIWTFYDEQEKKHWLSVHKGNLYERFLLQDNMLPAWHNNRKRLPERIHVAVDDMIRAIDRVESELQSSSPPTMTTPQGSNKKDDGGKDNR